MIAGHCLVNDQISFALTCKPIADAIICDTGLACNSIDPAIRFESWRYSWLPQYTVSPVAAVLSARGTARIDRRRLDARVARCKRKLQKEIRDRLNVKQRHGLQLVAVMPPGMEGTPTLGQEKDSDRSVDIAMRPCKSVRRSSRQAAHRARAHLELMTTNRAAVPPRFD